MQDIRLRRLLDTAKSAEVFGGTGLAHRPVLRESANHPLSLHEIAIVGANVIWVSEGFLNVVCFIFIRFIHRAFFALQKTENWSKILYKVYLSKDRKH